MPVTRDHPARKLGVQLGIRHNLGGGCRLVGPYGCRVASDILPTYRRTGLLEIDDWLAGERVRRVDVNESAIEGQIITGASASIVALVMERKKTV